MKNFNTFLQNQYSCNLLFNFRFGLNWNSQDLKTSETTTDRAKIRRETVGSEVWSGSNKEAPVQASSVQTEIRKDNIGFKLLKSMGWQEGKGLGKLENGTVEPVSFFLFQNSLLSLIRTRFSV